MTAEVEAYLAALPRDQAAALHALRATLRALLPEADECMSYAMPGFRMPNGRMAAGYAAFRHHLGLYPHSGNVVPGMDCGPFKTSKSGVLFTPAQTLPDALVRQIIDARLAEIASQPVKRR